MSERKDAGVRERFLIMGTLRLTSPTSLSNGDAEGLTDTAIRRDPISRKPLLPGSSLAGALRSFLTERLPDEQWLVKKLFGNVDRKESRQSWLFVDDALGKEKGVELRDGVALEPSSRTAADKLKFDHELLAAGTTFDLRLEFWLPASVKEQPERLREALVQALEGLASGDIQLGGRKRRGFGECLVSDWRVYRYDMGQLDGVLGWLEERKEPAPGDSLAEMMGLQAVVSLPLPNHCTLKATFSLTGSLLSRATPKEADGPDMVHLQNHAGEAVVAGTSVAGALRARARRIARLLLPAQRADALVNQLFGQEMREKTNAAPRASRLWVRETTVQKNGSVQDRVQSRVRLDRFTGGSYPGALFDQQPVWGGEVILEMTIRRPDLAEVGLLLLLLKDLWTGDLPLGGEASVGRGRLEGKSAGLGWQGKTWLIQADKDGLLQLTGEAEPLTKAVEAITIWGEQHGA